MKFNFIDQSSLKDKVFLLLFYLNNKIKQKEQKKKEKKANSKRKNKEK